MELNQRKAMEELFEKIKKEEQNTPIQFKMFLSEMQKNPRGTLRNIFQLIPDMIQHYVGEGKDEYEGDPESIGYKNYDFSRVFEKEVDNPFFADRILSNRLMNFFIGLKRQGALTNTILLMEGAPGSGKSNLLNNFLRRVEEFTRMPEGAMYETLWKLDTKFWTDKKGLLETSIVGELIGQSQDGLRNRFLEIPCPNHDHPILQIPKTHRRNFLEELLEKDETNKEIFGKKEFEWVFKKDACTICSSLYKKLNEKIKNPEEIFGMIYVKRNLFTKKLGEGISVYNPGDLIQEKPNENEYLQEQLSKLLQDSEAVRYTFSHLAKTNNGIFALMDVKDKNVKRLLGLHGVISDGVHKIGSAEERITSFFIGVLNPEDKRCYEKQESFKDRVTTIKVPYVLDYKTEQKIYQSNFSQKSLEKFFPGVLESFAKVIISSRLNPESKTIIEWLEDRRGYEKTLDEGNLILKMDIYTGKIPDWLTDKDRKKFTAKVRKQLIGESEFEGEGGISGRSSIKLLNELILKKSEQENLIEVEDIQKFFSEKQEKLKIPPKFLESVVNMYQYNILQEVKESIYFYNADQISKEIQNYLHCVNFEERGFTEKCPYTNEEIHVTEEYFSGIENILFDRTAGLEKKKEFRQGVQQNYVKKTLAQEIRVEGKKITETKQYNELFETYAKNLKENVLFPHVENANFRNAVIDYKTPEFQKYDSKMKRDVERMMENLQRKFGYKENGAKQIVQYVIDKELTLKF